MSVRYSNIVGATGDTSTELTGVELNLTGGFIHKNQWEIGLFVDTMLDGSGSNSDWDKDYEINDSTLGMHVAYRIDEKIKGYFGYAFQRQLGLKIDANTDVTYHGNGYLFGFTYMAGDSSMYSYTRGKPSTLIILR